MADEYIKRQALLDLLADEDRCGYLDEQDIKSVPAEDVVPVVKELRPAVKVLHEEYERAKNSPFVRDPLAYALYQVWKAADRGEIGR